MALRIHQGRGSDGSPVFCVTYSSTRVSLPKPLKVEGRFYWRDRPRLVAALGRQGHDVTGDDVLTRASIISLPIGRD